MPATIPTARLGQLEIEEDGAATRDGAGTGDADGEGTPVAAGAVEASFESASALPLPIDIARTAITLHRILLLLIRQPLSTRSIYIFFYWSNWPRLNCSLLNGFSAI